eukprot:9249803-Pyramimonas_sp.AAC.1
MAVAPAPLAVGVALLRAAGCRPFPVRMSALATVVCSGAPGGLPAASAPTASATRTQSSALPQWILEAPLVHCLVAM